MAPPKSIRASVRKAAASEPRRGSPLLLHMVVNHAKIAACAGPDGRIDWAGKLCPEFVRLGLVDGLGRPPTRQLAADVWRRACAAVERAAAAKAAKAAQPKYVPPCRRKPEGPPPSIPGPYYSPPLSPSPSRLGAALPPPPQPLPTAAAVHSVPGVVPAGSAARARGRGVLPDGRRVEDLTEEEKERFIEAKLAGVRAAEAHRDRFIPVPPKRRS